MADPNGKVGSLYDAFGICGAAASSAYATGAQTYAFSTGSFPPNLTTVYDDGKWNTTNTASNSAAVIEDSPNGNSFYTIKADGRTGRFGMAATFNGTKLDDVVRRPIITGYGSFGYDMTDWLPRGAYSVTAAYTDQFNRYGNNTNLNPAGGTGGLYYPGMWSQNNPANGPGTYNYDNNPSGNPGASGGVVRPGDDFYTSLSGDPAATDATSNTTGTKNIYQMADARPDRLESSVPERRRAWLRLS